MNEKKINLPVTTFEIIYEKTSEQNYCNRNRTFKTKLKEVKTV